MPVSGDGTATRGLGGARGFGERALPPADDGSMRIDVSAVFGDGLRFGATRHSATDLWVNSNGTLSLGGAFAAYPTVANAVPDSDLIALFWGDVDTRLDGEPPESGTIWVDIAPAAGVVTLTWDNVGVYRRDASRTNTVQVELHDRGGGNLDIAFRYESIGWVQGTATDDAGARAGLAGPSIGVPSWIAPGPDPSALSTLADTLGNTGVVGLWVYALRDGVIEDFGNGGSVLRGGDVGDTLEGTDFGDRIDGMGGDDILRGGAGADTLNGGEGRDTLNGGDGADILMGGASPTDLRDVIYGGTGDDRIQGGAGNDALYGQSGRDTIDGGMGADEIHGQEDDDTLSGSAFSDVIFGGDGADFINGGFGFDRVNGGAGGDRFFHLGVRDHGSDWIQDYRGADGDTLVFGGATTAPDQFQVNYAITPDAGWDGIAEAFVVYRPTGQILWALVDGAAQESLYIALNGQVFDLA